MKFLIVNGYPPSVRNLRLFQEFKNSIVEIISEQKEVVDNDYEYFIRERSTVDDFLYEPEQSAIKTDYGMRFDSLDMIFIAGTCTVRPWAPEMRKILTLIRMCLKTKKLLFTTSFGAQALAYLCASNMSINIDVTNNKGEGCKLVDFPKYTLQALKNGSSDYFLDSTTGDLYNYNRMTDEWTPKANAGIHCRREAAEFQSIGKYIIKSPTYKPKQTQYGQQFQRLNAGEVVCTVKKPFFHHWAFHNVPQEFVVTSNNTWDIHSFTFTNPERKFMILAENNQSGPLILESSNILCLHFEVSQKETLQILANFIDNGMKVIKFQHNYNAISIVNDKYFSQNKGIANIEIVFHHRHTTKLNGNPEELFRKQQKAFAQEQRKILNSAIQKTDRDNIFHVGFSVKKNRLPDFVSSNNIADKKYKIARRSSFIAKRSKILKQTQGESDEDDEDKQRILTESQMQQLLNGSLKVSTTKSTTRGVKFRSMNTSFRKALENRPDSIKGDTETEISVKPPPKLTITQQQTRSILHPSLDDEFLGQKQLWVPGYLSSARLKSSNVSRASLSGKMLTDAR